MIDIVALYDIFKSYPRISTDSRRVSEGSLFFALHGDNFDGNRFAAAALESGAEYVIVDDSSVVISDRYILVDDTLRALQELAAHHRRVLGVPVLAITGSNGKTTTKELVARVLARKFQVSVTQGNLNNHIGVPLTLLGLDSSCEFAVVEMGASACGEIALLCEIAAPNFGIITNIGRAHLEGFGGEIGVRLGKGELMNYLCKHSGTLFLRSDDRVLCAMADERVGINRIEYSAGEEVFRSQLVGNYNRYNIAAAAAIGTYFGVTTDQIADSVWSYVPDNNRSQRVSSPCNELIVDCYNSNPSSLSAALSNFAIELPEAGKGAMPCEKVVILGDMLELGEYSFSEHRRILESLAGLGIELAYVVGANFCAAAEGFHSEGYSLFRFADREDLSASLQCRPLRGKFILIKGSRGIGLEKIVEVLTAQ